MRIRAPLFLFPDGALRARGLLLQSSQPLCYDINLYRPSTATNNLQRNG
jgi:hypothetical protein